jgi:hypothetical protein
VTELTIVNPGLEAHSSNLANRVNAVGIRPATEISALAAFAAAGALAARLAIRAVSLHCEPPISSCAAKNSQVFYSCVFVIRTADFFACRANC